MMPTNVTHIDEEEIENASLSWHEIMDRLNLCTEFVNSPTLNPLVITTALHMPEFSKDFWDEIQEKLLCASFMAHDTFQEISEADDVPECNSDAWRNIITIVRDSKVRAKCMHKVLRHHYESNFIIAGCEDSDELLSEMVHRSFRLICGLTLLSTRITELAYMKSLRYSREKSHRLQILINLLEA